MCVCVWWYDTYVPLFYLDILPILLPTTLTFSPDVVKVSVESCISKLSCISQWVENVSDIFQPHLSPNLKDIESEPERGRGEHRSW